MGAVADLVQGSRSSGDIGSRRFIKGLGLQEQHLRITNAVLGNDTQALGHTFHFVFIVLFHQVSGHIAPGLVKDGSVEPGLTVTADGSIQARVGIPQHSGLIEAIHKRLGGLVEVIAAFFDSRGKPHVQVVTAIGGSTAEVADGENAFCAGFSAATEEVGIFRFQAVIVKRFKRVDSSKSLCPFLLEHFTLGQEGICGAFGSPAVLVLVETGGGIGEVLVNPGVDIGY